jgi:hypothetical protein
MITDWITSRYNKFANQVLLYHLDKKIWKLLFYPIVYLIDLVYYILNPLSFHINRKAACGNYYFLFNFGVVANSFDELHDFILRTQDGMPRKCPMLFIKLNESYEPPLASSTLFQDREPHRKNREAMSKFVKFTSLEGVPELVEKCIKNGQFEISQKEPNFKALFYNQLLKITTETINFENITTPLSLTFLLLLSTLIPQRYLVPQKMKEEVDKIAVLLQERHQISYDLALLTINGAGENGSNALMFLLYETIKQIQTNSLEEIVRRQLKIGNRDLLEKCIIEASRFVQYHAGSSMVESITTPTNVTIDGDEYHIDTSVPIIRNIPACLNDYSRFPKTFQPLGCHIQTVRQTTFNGLLSSNPDNRSCLGQEFSLEFITQLLTELYLNYTWSRLEIPFIETPLLNIVLKDIKRNE